MSAVLETPVTRTTVFDTDPFSDLRPRILSVGLATPPYSYTQAEMIDALGITDPKIRSIFLNSAIERRNLVLPPVGPAGGLRIESQGDLLDKHKRAALEFGAQALLRCLDQIGLDPAHLGHLCCVTSTGFLTPGLSAHLIKEVGIGRHCSRSDIVGMGCNAGLNALGVVSGWAQAHPGQVAVVLCIENCSAAYAYDATMRTAVVNSLFGDGAAAVAIGAREAGADDIGPMDAPVEGPRILKFASCLVPEAIDAMRYDWDRGLDRFSFYLDPQIPYVVGAHAELVVDRLLADTGLYRSDIKHWLVHSGGKKVIDAVMVNLGLSRYDLRHTSGVLRDHGNVSSGSFLFSYQRLAQENAGQPGDYGLMMTMGPGSTLETALLRW
ncbi:putative chalcone synthase [Kineosporia sp. NBRC 101677]|uniref:3,5-dihydroxyphenylacetyl-CoA synthase DpgA n=1 Tax=Kineosporia sp. NBRC 101677 TaxID=3032197 RepID=UPI0024A234E5|nr:3,5-dihydroxyphenylacetyl-CoA synthase DpgA [Kineosporia sp. NBRC 101677]GLY15820.1 putative chalcone synthase [Kineosporia sp. NBRC 101677]